MNTENREQVIKLIRDCVDNIIKLTAIPKISDGQRSQCHDIINRLNNLTVSISGMTSLRKLKSIWMHKKSLTLRKNLK